MFKVFNKTSIGIARPRPRKVHGIEVRKQPVGRYFEVMERAGNIIYELIEASFPGMTPANILAYFTTITSKELREIIIRLMGTVPARLVAILRDIVGAEDQAQWERLTPNEMLEVIKAFWELNDLTDFFKNARSVLASVTKQTQQISDTGSND